VLDTTPRVTLELSIKDLELVELFRDEIAPGVLLRRRERRTGRLGGPQVSVAVTSPMLVEGLARWGVGPRKTSNYRWPETLPHEMKRPYLLGHFDGDGFTTVSRSWGKYRYGRWGILGTRAFVEAVRDFLANELGVAQRAIHDRGGVFSYYVTGRDAVAIDQWLHRDLDLGIERKRLSVNAIATQATHGSRA